MCFVRAWVLVVGRAGALCWLAEEARGLLVSALWCLRALVQAAGILAALNL